jgi:four helix bundle protein
VRVFLQRTFTFTCTSPSTRRASARSVRHALARRDARPWDSCGVDFLWGPLRAALVVRAALRGPAKGGSDVRCFVPRSSHPSAAALFAGAALLDAEKLDCYRIALEFQVIAGQLVPKRGYAELRDQLDRASISIVLNIAEGCGRRSAADKGRFYAMARGSATECAAILDLVGARGLVDDRLRNRARSLLVRIVQMLSRLVARMTVPSGSQSQAAQASRISVPRLADSGGP